MNHATDTTFPALVHQADKPVLVDFSAEWCAPCKTQKPILQRFANAHPEVEVILVDVAEAPRVTNEYGVQGMPTLILFDGEKPVVTARGLQTLKRLEGMLEAL